MLAKLKYLIKQSARKCAHFVKSVCYFFYQNYGDTQRGIELLCKIIGSVLISTYVLDGAIETFSTNILIILLSIVIYGLFSLAQFLIRILIKPFLKYKISTILALVFFSYVVVYVIRMGDTSEKSSYIGFIIILLIESIFVRSIWAIIKNRKRNVIAFSTLIVTVVCNIFIAWFVCSEGFRGVSPKIYTSLQQNAENKILDSLGDTLEVSSITYGTSEDSDIVTGTTNLLNFTSYSGNFSKWLRTKYWGFGMNEVPLRGRIWYPTEGENYPVLFIIHGNHTMVTPSFLGYEYLGEYLASQGYVVVSVDETFLNGYLDSGMVEENDARAILLLENIKELLLHNEINKSLIYHKMDSGNIAIAGHSRGGEAVAIAALFNKYDRYPDNGFVKFDYNFDIKTVFAISPSCGQYEPGDRKVELKDINYFLIHGSHDMDVTEFMGMKQYKNVTFTGEGSYRKAYLYVANANHGQFNTKWGRYDLGNPGAWFLNTAPLIKEEEQKMILEKYIKVCLDVTLKSDFSNEDFLRDCEKYQGELPDTVYLQGYQDSSFTTICNYEEDSIIYEGTMSGSKIEASNVGWQEKYTRFTDVADYVYADRDNYAVRLNWNKISSGKYHIDLTEADLSKEKGKRFLQFDILDLDDTSVKNEIYEATDFSISIEYHDGSIDSYTLSDFKTIYPPIAVEISKLDYLFGDTIYKHHFQTVQLPIKNHESSIRSIDFIFDQQDNGEIMLDNVGLTN